MTAPDLATPRTEAMIDSCGDYEKAWHYQGRFADFARRLERENAALVAALERTVALFDALPAGHLARYEPLGINELRAALALARQS